MAPTLLSLGIAALALVGDVSATRFYLDETYDQTNFFDKFDFFVSDYSSPDYNDVDPTSGYVNYRSRHDAAELGLIKQLGDDTYIGVNSRDVTKFPGVGRDSVRIESRSLYNEGLMIARFTHLPKPVCGSWPAFWSFGDPWPTNGELDFYEGWNDGTINKPVIHSDHAAINGSCSLTNKGQTSIVTHDNCDTWGGIWDNQGCTTETTHEDPYGSDEGGIYAVEWTDEAIKFYSWTWAKRPANIDSESPDTSTWGTPSVLIASPSCEVKNHFRNHKLVINITFCGKAAGNDGIWAQSCFRSTRKSCSAYVAENPVDFEDTYWQVKDIRHFGLTRPPVTSTSSTSSTSTASSTSVAASTTSTTSTASVVSSSAESSTISSVESSSAISSEYDASSTTQEASSAFSSEVPVTSSEADSSSTFSSVSDVPASSTESDIPSSIATSVVPSSVSDEASSSIEASVSASSSVEASVSASISADVSVSASASSDIASSSTDIPSSSIISVISSDFSTRTIPVFVPSPTYYPVPSQSHHYGNSSTATSPYPISSSTSSCTDDEATTTYKTSTVYTTKISTITSCPTYVPNCEDREPQVVTEVVPAYTTVCPVEVSTRTIKHVHTITSCPPSVPSTACPYGSKSTETLYSTITKVLEEPPKSTGTDYRKNDDESDDYDGDDEDGDDEDGDDEDGDDEETPLSIIPTMTKDVYQTATVVPKPPTYSPTPPKNVTGSFRDGPSYEQITYSKPDLQAAAAPRSVGAGLAVVLGAAVAVLAL